MTSTTTASVIINVVLTVLSVVVSFVGYYFYVKQRITKAATDAVNDAEQKDKTGEEKKEIAVTQVYALIPAIYKPIITRAVVEGIVQAAFDKIEEYAKKQADKKKTK